MSEAQKTMWPNGKSCAVLVSVIFDDGLDAVTAAPDLRDRAKSFSVWKYGAARGVERLCRVFDTLGARTSWFVPGEVAQTHSDLLRMVVDAGHQIESRGWSFERYDTLSKAEALGHLRRARETLSAVSQQDVTGFRLPVGHWPRHFAPLLQEAGYIWSTSLNGDDIPYSHPSGLVEIPVHIELEDRPYFQFNFTPAFPKGQSRIPPYESVLNNWRMEFDAYRRFGACYVLQLRPEWSGTPGRIAIVEELLRYIKSFDDVWLATGAEIAAWHRASKQVISAQHPLSVYEAYLQEQTPNG